VTALVLKRSTSTYGESAPNPIASSSSLMVVGAQLDESNYDSVSEVDTTHQGGLVSTVDYARRERRLELAHTCEESSFRRLIHL
jgi:hypothetical protein